MDYMDCMDYMDGLDGYMYYMDYLSIQLLFSHETPMLIIVIGLINNLYEGDN